MTSPDAIMLRTMNKLKRNVAPDLLTNEQEEVLDEIRSHREDEAPFINLHGRADVGKTFLCWVLREIEGWEYYPEIPDKANQPVVIYDHGDPERMATRELRNHASINGLATVVYVTSSPAEEIYPRVELSPSEDHYEQVRANWDSLGLPVENAPIP